MRKKKPPDLLIIIALFVGFGLIATALSQELLLVRPSVISLDQTYELNTVAPNAQPH